LTEAIAGWVESALGYRPVDATLFARALTHASLTDSLGEASYERLEFLGDRVLGLVMAEWLFETFPDEAEGQLTKRFNTLVTGAVCAEVARAIGVAAQVRLGKQGRDDGVQHGGHVLGDVMEALLGALYLERGLAPTREAIRRLWADRIHADAKVPQHPKSALQEWAAANRRAAPVYALVHRQGPDHAPRLTVSVTVGPDSVTAEGTSKQEAETAAATALLATLQERTPVRRRRKRG
jgi:ribonuclease-3